MGKLTQVQAIDKVVAAHTDLNVFHAIMQLMEGGVLYDPRSKEAAHRIITICKRESARSLRAYDAGRAALAEGEVKT